MFKLLGLYFIFSGNLSDIPNQNYPLAIKKAISIVNQWKIRLLTPIGRIVLLNIDTSSIQSYIFIHYNTQISSR